MEALTVRFNPLNRGFLILTLLLGTWSTHPLLSFNPLNRGFLILTKATVKWFDGKRGCFNPLNRGFLILTGAQSSTDVVVTKVSIPLIGAF